MNRNLHGGFLIVAVFHYLLVFDVNFCFGQNVGDQKTNSHRVAKRQTLNCTQYQHACKKGDKCIDRALLCDGVKDCSDGSDETETLCKSIPCPSYSFQCNYGACIDSAAKCDGRVDCADNSDETDLECPPLISDAHVAKHCKSNQFQCASGRCIDAHLACNGKRDCDDGSDETIRHCENHVCPKTSFQCKYGACIDKKLRCDGVKHCPDGSDEFSQTCKTPTETVTPTPKPTPPTSDSDSQTPGSCALPQSTADKKFTVNCPDGTSCSHHPGKKVPKYTEVTFHCQPGYVSEEGNTFQSICSNGAWIPPINKCSKICKALKPKNVDLTCTRKGLEVDCNGVLLAGTSVRPRCKPQHHEEFPVYYREITCEPDGEWTNPLFRCVPECGKPYANVTKLIAFGEPEKYGDSPWQVAVYNVMREGTPLICGGTIISPQLIASAAHCFYDDKPLPASDYEIVVSKVTRNYSIFDNGLTKRYKIRQIFFSDKGYFGTSNNYAADIVILWVAEKISLSRAVLPACIKWTDRGPFNPGEGTPGKVVGWGLDQKGIISDILLVANLPFISYKKCTDMANADFRDIITLDKFCAGTEKGTGVREGDSGGGLLFRDQTSGLYYLRGIVSVKETTETSIAVFTDVTQYLDWIDKIRNQIENETILTENTLGQKT